MGGSDSVEQPQEKVYAPFPRLRESDPYRLLGLTKEAAFEEVTSARNFLFEEYRWHEPSREAIEVAFENIMQDKLKVRHKTGFKAAPNGRHGPVERTVAPPSLGRRIGDLFDPTVTFRTLINEGLIYIALALWALCSTDQSFPLAGTYAYSVYKFQTKRMKTNPEGPFFGGNPIIGAVITTTAALALGCGIVTLLTAPLTSVIEGTLRQVGGFIVISLMGTLSVYLK